MRTIICTVSLCLSLLSCATYEKFDIPDPYEEQKKQEAINQFLVGLTYDECLMVFREPTSTTQGDAIFLATWKNEKEDLLSWPLKVGKKQVHYHLTISHGQKLELVFDKVTRRVIDWSIKNW